MSELFAVRVLDVTKESARLQVTSVHPDSGPPAPRAVFALMLMYDPIINSGYSDFSKYRHLEASPLAQAMDRDNYLDSPWLKQHARGFVAKAKVSKGVLEIWPTHPAWIEHLRKGMTWDTAAYDGGPGLPAPPRAPSVRAPSQRVDDPKAGFRVGKPKYEEYKVAEAFVPLYGPNRYLADPVISDAAAMKKATKTMIGQPVLTVPKRGPNRVGTIVQLRKDGVMLYHETEHGYGAGGVDFSELKSLGRAWLIQDNAPAVPAKPAATNTAAKTAAPRATAEKTATKKTATKAVAKKTTTKAAAKTTTSRPAAKTTTTRAAAKTTTTKAAAKQTATGKAAAKKTPAKKTAKTSASKAAARTTPAKKTAKASARKAAARKTPAKKTAKTSAGKVAR
jgi:hypothetical protein